MKKTILAIAIPALFASAANAAVIYDKDGTQVGITGNLRTQFVSDHDKKAEDLGGRARIGLSTKVALNDTWSGLAKGEWQLTSNKSTEGDDGDDITYREVSVGLDGSQFGMIRFGQLDTVFNDVINKADIANENSGLASVYDGRQEGQVRYDGQWNGVSFGASYITANTGYKDVGSNNGLVELTGDLDRGYAAKLGYEAPFGLALIAGLEHLTGMVGGETGIDATAAALVEGKMGATYLGLFVLGILCNICIFIAVNGYANNPHQVGKYLALFLGVSVFILCGTEHSVADMYYWSVSGVLYAQPGESVLRLLIISLGNVVGGVFFPLMEKGKRRLDLPEAP